MPFRDALWEPLLGRRILERGSRGRVRSSEGVPRLSDEDVEAILEDVTAECSGMGLKEWFKTVVEVVEMVKETSELSRLRKRFRRHTGSEVGSCPGNIEPRTVGDIVVNPRLAYRVRMAAYVFDDEKFQETLLCYSRY